MLRCPLHDLCWYLNLCFQGSVQAILDRKNEMDNQAHICEQLGKANTFLLNFMMVFLITTSKIMKLKMVIK